MLPKEGTKLHRPNSGQELAHLVAGALSLELGKTHQAVKTAMRWTGASERTVKHWLAGTHAPSGLHMVALCRHSDDLQKQLLICAGRGELAVALEFTALREKLVLALAACEQILEVTPRAFNRNKEL